MATLWCGLVLVISIVLGVGGPSLESSLPKSRSMQRPGTGKTVFSANFEGIFRTNTISLPKHAGEHRIAFVGNSALARAHFADQFQVAMAKSDPEAKVYGLAWPGLNVSGQGLFVRRATAFDVDMLVWAISPFDCLDAPAVFDRTASVLEIQPGAGPVQALADLRLLARDNGPIVLFNLLGAIFPHVRYGNALAELAPRLPDLKPKRASLGAPAGREAPPRAPSVPIATRNTHPPVVALRALEAAYPLLREHGTRLTLLVMPHHDPDAWFGQGQLEEFQGELRGWARANGARVIDLSKLLPSSAFWDGVHFYEEFDGTVVNAIAEPLRVEKPR